MFERGNAEVGPALRARGSCGLGRAVGHRRPLRSRSCLGPARSARRAGGGGAGERGLRCRDAAAGAGRGAGAALKPGLAVAGAAGVPPERRPLESSGRRRRFPELLPPEARGSRRTGEVGSSVHVFSLVALFPYLCTLVFIRSAHFEKKNVIFELLTCSLLCHTCLSLILLVKGHQSIRNGKLLKAITQSSFLKK